MDIMKWRNEQIYHLRQSHLLTEEDQENYFENVVLKLFEQNQPNQILFSFLENDVCIGYGGLVHINWLDKNAEISFVMNTDLEVNRFQELWITYLSLIEVVAFANLNFHKIYTYAFDLRPQLNEVLLKSNYVEEARLQEHCFFESKFIDVVIHSKINNLIEIRRALAEDVQITYEWASNKIVRNYSIQKGEIVFEEHKMWFFNKISTDNCLYYIFEVNKIPIGSIRFDIKNENEAVLSFLLDPNFHGKGYGKKLLEKGCKELLKLRQLKRIEGLVNVENLPSIKTFLSSGFNQVNQIGAYLTFEKKIEI